MEIPTLPRETVVKILDILGNPLDVEWTVYHAGKRGNAVSTVYSIRETTKKDVLKFFPEGGQVDTSVKAQWYGRTKIKKPWADEENIFDEISYDAMLTAYGFTITFHDVDFSGEEAPASAKYAVEQLKEKLAAIKGCKRTLTIGTEVDD